MLIRLRNLIPTDAKLQLFIWHFCKSSDSRRLEMVQERGLRAVYKDKHSTYERLLQKAKLPTLLNRRLQDICILMYKVKHNLSPLNISNIFQVHNSSYNLRQSDFSVPRYSTHSDLWQTFIALFRTHIMEQTDNCRQISYIVSQF